MDGVTTFRRMKGLRPDVRVILSTGYDELDVTRRFSEEGFAGFLQKPFLLEELEAKIGELPAPPR
jgi:DNA-binding NtrC family response regulator